MMKKKSFMCYIFRGYDRKEIILRQIFFCKAPFRSRENSLTGSTGNEAGVHRQFSTDLEGPRRSSQSWRKTIGTSEEPKKKKCRKHMCGSERSYTGNYLRNSIFFKSMSSELQKNKVSPPACRVFV